MAKRARTKRCNTQSRDIDYTRKNKRNKRNNNSADIVQLNPLSKTDTAYCPKQDLTPFKPKNAAQKKYINAMRHNSLTFGLGPAGTGKSYCAGALAAEYLQTGQIERIIITRPAVEAGESLGFLPGDIEEKFSAYIDAFRDILNERLGEGAVNYALRHGRIIAAPLAFMRGKTFKDNTFVILDEAQNTSPEQMKMFLTRIGENCKVVINGDIRQSDIRGPNGLQDAVNKMKDINKVSIHQFEREDIVRSGLVREIIDRYEYPEE